jgi:hypothetical protein
MSQSDYIQYKKTQQVLFDQKKLPQILEPNNYTTFEKYTVETTVPNTKLRHSRLIPTSTVSVLEMDRKTTNCPAFTMCKNTQTRPNRVLNTISKPEPTYRLNKIKKPKVCTFIYNKYKKRQCTCSKTLCKCGTTIC